LPIFRLSLFSLRWLISFYAFIIFDYSAFIFSRAIADTPFHFSLPTLFSRFRYAARCRDISPGHAASPLDSCHFSFRHSFSAADIDCSFRFHFLHFRHY
jgi:hypothetical protein